MLNSFHYSYDWTNPQKALNEMASNMVKDMKCEEEWYIIHRKRHGTLTRIIRVVSILLFALGILWPMVKKHFPLLIQKDLDVGYLSLAIGGILVLLDKYLGISAGFVRFYIAELDIKKNTLEFAENWQTELVKSSTPLTTENILSLLNIIKTFRRSVLTTIQVETGAWASEFQNQSSELYELFKQKQNDSKTGDISVNIKNHFGYSNLEVGVDDAEPIPLNGKTSIIFKNLSIELHLVLIRALKDDKIFSHSENITVSAEKSAEIAITLP